MFIYAQTRVVNRYGRRAAPQGRGETTRFINVYKCAGMQIFRFFRGDDDDGSLLPRGSFTTSPPLTTTTTQMDDKKKTARDDGIVKTFVNFFFLYPFPAFPRSLGVSAIIMQIRCANAIRRRNIKLRHFE